MIIKNNLLKNIMSLGIATMVLSQACSPLLVKGTELYKTTSEALSGPAIDIEDPNWTDTDQDSTEVENPSVDPVEPEEGTDENTDENGTGSTEHPSYGGDDKGKPNNKPNKPNRPDRPNKPVQPAQPEQSVQAVEEEVPFFDPELATQQVGAPQRMRLEMPEVVEETTVSSDESKVQVLLPSEERKVAKVEASQGVLVVDKKQKEEKELVIFDSNEGTTTIKKNAIIAQNVDAVEDNTYNVLYKEDNKIKQVKVKIDEEISSQEVEPSTASNNKKENKKKVEMVADATSTQNNLFVINTEVEEEKDVQLSAKQLVQNELSKSTVGAKQSALFGANELILTGLTFTLAGSYLVAPTMKRRK